MVYDKNNVYEEIQIEAFYKSFELKTKRISLSKLMPVVMVYLIKISRPYNGVFINVKFFAWEAPRVHLPNFHSQKGGIWECYYI